MVAVAVFVVFIIGTAFYGAYNDIVAKDERCKTQWGNVENVYQRRLDLLPNLANVVERYAKHEKETLAVVAQARSMKPEIKMTPELLNDPSALKKFNQAQGDISSLVSRLLSVQENYPNLKADQQFLNLQTEIAGTENRIAVERRRYNETVNDLNTTIRGLWGKFVNGFAGVAMRSAFEADADARHAPKIMAP
jgi:LemA protein